MIQSKAIGLLIEILKNRWKTAVVALVLAFLTSFLEGVSASLVLPLLQVLGDDTNMSSQSPQFLSVLTNFYKQLPAHLSLLAVVSSFWGVTIVKNINKYLADVNINKLQLQTGLILREKCVERFLQLDLLFYSQSKTGELLTYINEHVQRSQNLALYVLEMVSDALTILLLLIFLVRLSPLLTIVSFVSLLLLALSLKPIVKAVQINGRKAAKSIESFSEIITEILTGMRVIKSFNSEEIEFKNAKKSLYERYETEFTAYKYNSGVIPLTETAGITVLLLLLALGSSSLPGTESLTLPVLLTYTFALLRILPRVSHLNSVRAALFLLLGSLEAVQHFLNRTEKLYLTDGTSSYKTIQEGLRFENVTFSFPNTSEPTLKEINFNIPKGKMTALVGPSGSGKSTLADLVMRFHDPNEGRILVDGIDLREYQLSFWRKSVAMVSQDTFLFHTSVKENIAYGRPNIPDSEIIEAAKKAYAYDFIQELPEGFNTILGNRGTRLSGGQRQRIAIARAFLRNPDILILDEATSALDTHSEQIVQKAIEEISQNRTVIVIAHRLSTIEKADNIVVLRKGCVIEQGSHQDLLERQGAYSLLYKSQAFSAQVV